MAELVTTIKIVKTKNNCCNKQYKFTVPGYDDVIVGCKCEIMFFMIESAKAFFALHPDCVDTLLIPFSKSKTYFKIDRSHRYVGMSEPIPPAVEIVEKF